LLAALALGAGCSAIYWLPAVVERPLVHADWLEKNPVYQFQEHFLFSPGRVDMSQDPIQGRVKSEEDLPTVRRVRRGLLLTLILAGAAWVFQSFPWSSGPGRRRQQDSLRRYLLLSLLSTLAMTRLASPLWHFLPGLSAVAFPWRLSIFVTLAAAVLISSTAVRLSSGFRWGRLWMVSAVLLGGLLITLKVASGADWRRFTRSYAASPAVMLRVAGVFMPRSNPAMRGFQRHPRAAGGHMVEDTGLPRTVLHTVVSQNHRHVFDIQIPPGHQRTMRLDTFDYPGWNALLDGTPVGHGRGPLGTLEIAVPPGRHRVEWIFGSTLLRRFAGLVSLLSLILTGALALLHSNPTLDR
ncbi:MAG: hypothetical protein ACE5ID_12915, partial [Acidobacteriota bacterium]